MELAEWRGRQRFSSDLGTASVPDNDAIVVRYLDWCEWRNRTPQTLRSYHSTLLSWVEWLGARSLLDVDRADMESFMERRRKRRGKGRMGSPATRRREASCLRSFYQWVTDEKLLAENPAAALQGPTVHNTNPKPVPDADWRRVWDSQLTDGERLFLGLGYYCGLRRYEIVNLQASQVTNTRITNFVRKGGGEHTLPWAEMVGVYEDELPELGDTGVFSAVLHRARKGDGLLLPWHTTDPQALNKRLYQIQSRLGLPESAWFTPHQLRHSCATNLLRAGVPLHLVSSLLNHTNPATTMRYVRAGGSELREWRSRK